MYFFLPPPTSSAIRLAHKTSCHCGGSVVGCMPGLNPESDFFLFSIFVNFPKCHHLQLPCILLYIQNITQLYFCFEIIVFTLAMLPVVAIRQVWLDSFVYSVSELDLLQL